MNALTRMHISRILFNHAFGMIFTKIQKFLQITKGNVMSQEAWDLEVTDITRKRDEGPIYVTLIIIALVFHFIGNAGGHYLVPLLPKGTNQIFLWFEVGGGALFLLALWVGFGFWYGLKNPYTYNPKRHEWKVYALLVMVVATILAFIAVFGLNMIPTKSLSKYIIIFGTICMIELLLLSTTFGKLHGGEKNTSNKIIFESPDNPKQAQRVILK